MNYSRLFRKYVAHDLESRLTSSSLACAITREFDLIDVTLNSGQQHRGHSRLQFEPHILRVLHAEDFPYLPSFKVFSYDGNFIVQAIDFLQPLLIRSRVREGSSGTDLNLGKSCSSKKGKDQGGGGTWKIDQHSQFCFRGSG